MKQIGRTLILLLLIMTLGVSLVSLVSCGGDGEGEGGESSGEGGEETGTKTYTVRVTMGDGSPATSFVVQINKGDEQIGLKRVGDDGTVSFTLERDDYDVTLIPIGAISYWADPEEMKIAKGSDGTDIQLYGVPDREDIVFISDDEYSEPKAQTAYHVGAGIYHIGLQADGYSYFIFTPSVRGIYEIGAKDEENQLEAVYLGSPDNPMRINLDVVDGKFKLEVRSYNIAVDGGLSTTYLIGVKGGNIDTGTLEIIKTDAEIEPSPLEGEWINYRPASSPEKVTVSYANKQITVNDLNIAGEEIILVLCEDGYYRLGTADGPLVYVKVNCESKYLGAFSNVAENGQFSSYFYGEDGKFTHKESYNEAIMEYSKASDDVTGLYPLDEYLREAIIKCGEFRGWWNPDSMNYRFGGVEYNENNAWMFALCTVASEELGVSADAPCQLTPESLLLLSGGERVYVTCYLSAGDAVTLKSLPEGSTVSVGENTVAVEGGKATVTATADGNVVICIIAGGESGTDYEISYDF